MTYAEQLKLLDDAFKVERVKAVIFQTPPLAKPEPNDVTGGRIYQLNTEAPSIMPSRAHHHLVNALNELNPTNWGLLDPLSKRRYYKSIRQCLKSANLLDHVGRRIEPAIHAMTRANFTEAEFFVSKYKGLYAAAQKLTDIARSLPLVKNQSKFERLEDDKMLYAKSIVLLTELRDLCHQYIDMLKPYIKSI